MFISSLRKCTAAASLKPPLRVTLAACFLLFCPASRAAVPAADGADEARQFSDKMNAWFCDGDKHVLPVSSGPAADSGGAAAEEAGEDAFSPLKPEGTRRVFVIGGSAARLLGPGETSSLNAVVENIFPGEPLELVNCAPRTYGNRKVSDVYEKVMDYEPDLVVVLGGSDAPGREPEAGSGKGEGSSAMAPEAAAAEAALAAQEKEFRAMARLSRAKDVPVVFCTLPADMCGYAPSGELPFEQAWLLKGMALLEEKDFAGALKLFELNLKKHPREPFSLFYAGRALDGLGRVKDSAAYYSAAMKYDPAPDKCPAGSNGMIRRAAAEEGACLADLERAFYGPAADGTAGSPAPAYGQRWSPEYGVFVSSVIGRAAQGCLPAAGGAAGEAPAPAAAPGRPEYAAEDFGAIFLNAVSGLSAGAFCDAPARERTVVMLERLYSMDPARLEGLLFSTGGGPAAPGPGLLYNAAEMFRRSGNAALARRCVDAALLLKADCPAFNLARWRISRAAGGAAGDGTDLAKAAAGPRTRVFLAYLDAALDLAPGPLPAAAAAGAAAGKKTARDAGPSKKMSDEAVELMKKGDLEGARALLTRAVARDGDNFEARMNLCSLAAKAGDAALGGEHCSEAVFLAVAPPKHAVLSGDRPSSAFYARGLFYLKTGNKAEACRDLKRAAAEAPSGWPTAAEARAQAEKACAGK